MFDNRKLYLVRNLTVIITLLALVAGTSLPGLSVSAAARTSRQPGAYFLSLTSSGEIRKMAATAGAHLTYYGGPVISNMKVVLVAFGNGTILSGEPGASWLPAFTNQFLGSGVMDWLSEYDTNVPGGTNQHIGRATYLGEVTVNNPSSGSSSIADSEVQTVLFQNIRSGVLPAPDADTSYAVFFPRGQSVCLGAGALWCNSAPTTRRSRSPMG